MFPGWEDYTLCRPALPIEVDFLFGNSHCGKWNNARMNSFKENFFLLHKCTFQQHNEWISILVIFLPKRITLPNTSLLSPRHGNNCSITSLWHEINTFPPHVFVTDEGEEALMRTIRNKCPLMGRLGNMWLSPLGEAGGDVPTHLLRKLRNKKIENYLLTPR